MKKLLYLATVIILVLTGCADYPVSSKGGLIMEGGKERTGNEYKNLLEAAGLKLTGIIPTKSPYSLAEGAYM